MKAQVARNEQMKRGFFHDITREVSHLPVTEKETKPRWSCKSKTIELQLHILFNCSTLAPKTNKQTKREKRKLRAWPTLSHRENQSIFFFLKCVFIYTKQPQL